MAGGQQPADHPDGGGLACPVGPNEPEEFTGFARYRLRSLTAALLRYTLFGFSSLIIMSCAILPFPIVSVFRPHPQPIFPVSDASDQTCRWRWKLTAGRSAARSRRLDNFQPHRSDDSIRSDRLPWFSTDEPDVGDIGRKLFHQGVGCHPLRFKYKDCSRHGSKNFPFR